MTIYTLGTRSMPVAGLSNGCAREAAIQGEWPSKPDSLGGPTVTVDDIFDVELVLHAERARTSRLFLVTPVGVMSGGILPRT